MNISVIIPTYNRVCVVERAIESVLNQTVPPTELIVVDDGSTDSTADVLAAFGTSIIVIRQANGGVSAARNTGIRHARYEWLSFLDSDDYWLPSKLEDQITYLAQHPHLRVCQSGDIWIRNGRRVNPRNVHQKGDGWIFHLCLPRCVVSSSDVILHRSVLDDVGVFDESLPACEDYDLYLRIAKGYQIGLVPQVGTVKHGGHEDQLSRAFWGMDRFRVKALMKLLRTDLTEQQQHATLVTLEKKLRVLIKGGRKHKPPELTEWEAHYSHVSQLLSDFEGRQID